MQACCDQDCSLNALHKLLFTTNNTESNYKSMAQQVTVKCLRENVVTDYMLMDIIMAALLTWKFVIVRRHKGTSRNTCLGSFPDDTYIGLTTYLHSSKRPQPVVSQRQHGVSQIWVLMHLLSSLYDCDD